MVSSGKHILNGRRPEAIVVNPDTYEDPMYMFNDYKDALRKAHSLNQRDDGTFWTVLMFVHEGKPRNQEDSFEGCGGWIRTEFEGATWQIRWPDEQGN